MIAYLTFIKALPLFHVLYLVRGPENVHIFGDQAGMHAYLTEAQPATHVGVRQLGITGKKPG